MAKLVDSVANAKAAAIGFDVLFSETERAPSDALLEGPVNGVDANIASRSESDAAFAQALADRSVVLSELVTQSDIAGAVPAKSGFTTIGEDPTPDLPHLNGVLGPLPVLAKSAAGIGFVNWQADADRVVRRVPLLIVVNGRIQPSFAMECLRVAQGASTYLIKSADAGGPSLGQGAGVAAIKVGDLVVSTQPAGDIRAYFAATDPSLSSAGMETVRARRRSLRPRRQDRRHRRQRVAAVGRRRDAAQSVDAGRRGASAIDRADHRRRRIAASRLGPRGRSRGGDLAVARARRRDAAAVGAVERGSRRIGRRGDGGRQLAGLHALWLAARSGHAQLLLRRGLSCRRARALQPEAASVERDALAFRTVRFARGGRATGRASGRHSTGRRCSARSP